MTIQYNLKSLERRGSVIIGKDGREHTSIGRTNTGFSANVRFFGSSDSQPSHVVKRPCPTHKYESIESYQYTPHELKQFKKEQELWNLVYPDQPAELIVTDEAIRLVLPCFPGKTLSNSLNDNKDPLVYCQKILVLAKAIKAFFALGLEHNDFSVDNALLDQDEDGNFKAYLIDFGGVVRRSNQPNSHDSDSIWVVLNSLIAPGKSGINSDTWWERVASHSPSRSLNYRDIDKLIHDLSNEIEVLSSSSEGKLDCK